MEIYLRVIFNLYSLMTDDFEHFFHVDISHLYFFGDCLFKISTHFFHYIIHLLIKSKSDLHILRWMLCKYILDLWQDEEK